MKKRRNALSDDRKDEAADDRSGTLATDGVADRMARMAQACLRQKELTSAEGYFQLALQADPDHPGGLAGLIQLALCREDMDQARVLETRLRRTGAAPDLAAAMQCFIGFLRVCRELGGPGQLSETAARAPNDARLLYVLAACTAVHGDLICALEHLSLILGEHVTLAGLDATEAMQDVLLVAEEQGLDVDGYWSRLPHGRPAA